MQNINKLLISFRFLILFWIGRCRVYFYYKKIMNMMSCWKNIYRMGFINHSIAFQEIPIMILILNLVKKDISKLKN